MLLYNAVRFLLHNYESTRSFVSQYFDGYDIDAKDNYSCPALKRAIMARGIIETAKEGLELNFHYVDGPPHPLNDILKHLLVLFAARYAAFKSNVTRQQYERRTGRQDRGTIPVELTVVVDDNGNIVTPSRQAPDEEVDWEVISAMADKNRLSPLAAGVPTDDASGLVKKLADHRTVKAIFTRYLKETSTWRGEDKIQGDRLSNYLQPIVQNPLQTDDQPASAKRPRSQL